MLYLYTQFVAEAGKVLFHWFRRFEFLMSHFAFLPPHRYAWLRPRALILAFTTWVPRNDFHAILETCVPWTQPKVCQSVFFVCMQSEMQSPSDLLYIDFASKHWSSQWEVGCPCSGTSSLSGGLANRSLLEGMSSRCVWPRESGTYYALCSVFKWKWYLKREAGRMWFRRRARRLSLWCLKSH